MAKDKGIEIIPVKDYSEQKKVILLRHDIDFSLEYAYELANFEYDLGIKSSYYVYLHAPTYNALSPKSMGMIRAMKGMGHEIGLHYDSRYNIEDEEIIVARIADTNCNSATQHFPASNGRIFGSVWIDPNDLKIKYISDSGRNWREKCLCSNIGKHDKLHVNMHPEWWCSNSNSREDMIKKLYLSQHATLQKDIEGIREMLSDYERDVINK
jgi:hypothetical protein